MAKHFRPASSDPEVEGLFAAELSVEAVGYHEPTTTTVAHFDTSGPGYVQPPIVELSPTGAETKPALDPRLQVSAHLVSVLDNLTAANRLSGFGRATLAPRHRTRLQFSFGGQESLAAVAGQFDYKRRWLEDDAFSEFTTAYEIANGPVGNDDKSVRTLELVYTQFKDWFQGTANKKALDKQRRLLNRPIKDNDAEAASKAYLLLRLTEVPKKTAPIVAERFEATTESQRRLRILRDDPGAGFLPHTNREKNHAYALLSSKQRLAAQERLMIIHDHNVGAATKRGADYREALEFGQETMLSLVNEYVDYRDSAAASLEALRDLQAMLASSTIDRYLPLADEVAESHPAYAVLARFADINLLAERGAVSFGYDPLRTKEDRYPEPDRATGKHKTVQDSYTGVVIPDKVAARIRDFAFATDVDSAQLLLEKAIASEEAGLAFWSAVLEQPTGSVRGAAQTALVAAGVE